MSKLQQFRDQIDEFFFSHPQSPLEPQDRTVPSSLAYYGETDALVFEVGVKRVDDPTPIQMQTSTGEAVVYKRWGLVRFEVDGEEAELVIYSDPSGRDLFMPFKDATNGEDTYGAGRYLDNHRPGLEWVQRSGKKKLRIDFNYAYNPYCAYSPYFSCPLPPRENWLDVSIKAGEKNFQKAAL